MNLLFDIETDGLIATKIWCIVAYDIDEGIAHTFDPDHIDEAIEFLQKADKLIDLVLEQVGSVNEKLVKQEKYSLVKED